MKFLSGERRSQQLKIDGAVKANQEAHMSQQMSGKSKFLSPVRRRIRRLILATIDKGWLGLKPLQTHVVICGFPRSGSTLLLLIAETCVSDAKTFGQERPALGYHAQNELRNHSLMITKKPDDILQTDEIRAFYASRKAQVRFILTMRDPRDILTSFHPSSSEGHYYVSPERWRKTCEHFRHASQFDDAIVVKFEDLVFQPSIVQQRLTEFIGWRVHTSFDQFHTKASPTFKGEAMHTLRPLDNSTINKWKQERHRPRIQSLLREMPELPERLIEMGYESDTLWTQDYE
ncbi:sulfotransferase domain-containing protein [Candidatus Poribacteria bacterium]|nr:sulfotransferase domain-containing protein [Candidatus Poribacteria bacterium]